MAGGRFFAICVLASRASGAGGEASAAIREWVWWEAESPKSSSFPQKPLFWLNGLSAALFLAYSLATFPTRDRAMEMFRDFAGRLEEAATR